MKRRYVPVATRWWPAVPSLIVSLLITVAFHSVSFAAFSLEDLEGAWVPERSLKIFQKTLSPSAARGAEIVIRPADDGSIYELLFVHFGDSDGLRYHVLGVSPTKEADLYRLRVALAMGPEGRGSPEELRVRVILRARDWVESIIFLDGTIDSRMVNQVFVRIPALNWSRYVNRLVFAGIWTDQNGQDFAFCECGEGYGAGGTFFTYKVPFSLVTNPIDTVGDVIFVHPFNALDPEAHPMGPAHPNASGQYKFKRVKNELRLSNFPPRSDAQNTHEIILHKK